MDYIAKHSAEQKHWEAREEFYADSGIWDNEFDDPYEVQDEAPEQIEAAA